MIKRFFKLIYILSLMGIVVSIPIFLLTSIEADKIVISSYKAKCLSNGKYVILEGDSKPYIFDEIVLNDTKYSDTQKTLNFYCKYYDSVQPYIAAYVDSKTLEEQKAANINFFNFRENVISNIYSYPPLYELESVKEETHLEEVYYPVFECFMLAILAFILLQALRMFYMYIVFNVVAWHPFKSGKNQ